MFLTTILNFNCIHFKVKTTILYTLKVKTTIDFYTKFYYSSLILIFYYSSLVLIFTANLYYRPRLKGAARPSAMRKGPV